MREYAILRLRSGFRDKYNGQSTDKIRTKMPHDRPALSQSDKMAGWKCAAARALECPLFPSASMSSSRDTAPQKSRHSGNGHVQNFDWQDVDVALFPGLLHLKN